MERTSFSESVKREICDHNYKYRNQVNLLAPFLMNKINFGDDNFFNATWTNLTLTIYFNFVAKKIFEIIRLIFSKIDVVLIQKKNQNKIILRDNQNQVSKKIIDFVKNEKYLLKGNASVFLAGVFLACGSLNNLENLNHHLEIQCNNSFFFHAVAKALVFCKMHPRSMTRKQKKVIYFKRVEEISDFLKLIHADVSTLAFENQRVVQNFNNIIQKKNNFDITNLWRTIKTSSWQIESIRKLITTKEIYTFSKNFQTFCFLRIKYPTASFTQLVQLYNQKCSKKITRSGISYYVNKLKSYELDKKKNF